MLRTIGFHGDGRFDASDLYAWLELHVEQSERLEQMGVPLGVVTTITGTSRLRGTIDGTAEHSGSSKMSERTDARAAASEFILEMERAAQAEAGADGTAVATVGELSVDPGVVNVIPGAVEFSVDVRNVEGGVIERLVDRAAETLDSLKADRGVETTLARPYEIQPVEMASVCRDAVHGAGSTLGMETADIHSEAGHDTIQVATVTDAGLLFASSEGGQSHNPLERTYWIDCAVATDVLTTALYTLATDGAGDANRRPTHKHTQ